MPEPLRYFLEGRTMTPANLRWHWGARARWADAWRTLASLSTTSEVRRRAGWADLPPAEPKHVHFRLHLFNLTDDDNLPGTAKPARDGLTDAGLIQNDGPRDGHRFTYSQVIDRARRGIEICVHLRSECNRGDLCGCDG